ncbi:hypothetical protein G7K_2739-t1 [Saitoella complicata NRRL Y-17804]|uniref:Actin interacting protein 3 C-terminal domain-containing protein n=3 Tax=Saitoella complicata (strain BCRC 22490 / CBS 7301 / JCM 7358 / NBRC 10748 / NRRL Y-17804) TaxID=698492 RepID=A0A0E9NFV3_SAICN|nr:hypothetical protein G7K_2739-t1 [Saitoella complicata NRRL Y-17804]
MSRPFNRSVSSGSSDQRQLLSSSTGSGSAVPSDRAVLSSTPSYSQTYVSNAVSSNVLSREGTDRRPSTGSNTMNRAPSAMSSSGSMRRSNPIEASVTKLLVETKTLLETLTSWSQGMAGEGDVSDVYVRLGNEFNIACAAFTRANIEMNDLLRVPQDLRMVLETALAEDPTPDTLERYLPRIRGIIIQLLQGLKRKQARYRVASGSGVSQPSISRTRSAQESRSGTNSPPIMPLPPPQPEPFDEQRLPNPRKPPVQLPVQHDYFPATPSPPPPPPPPPLKELPVPTLGEPVHPLPSSDEPSLPLPRHRNAAGNDPLAALQNSEMLARRASKRYSTYHLKGGAVAAAGPRIGGPGESPPVPQLPKDAAAYNHDRVKTGLGLEVLPIEEDQAGTPRSRDAPSLPSPTFSRTDTRTDTTSAAAVSSEASLVPDTAVRCMQVYLQLGQSTKKHQLSPADMEELSMSSLRLLFLEKFDYNPASNTEFPHIYIADKGTTIRYELENIGDIKEGVVLSLNIHELDEVKKHIDEGLAGVLKEFAGLRKEVEKLREAKQDTRFERPTPATPSTQNSVPSGTPSAGDSSVNPQAANAQLNILSQLRADLGAIRQVHSTFVQKTQSDMENIKDKAKAISKVATSTGAERKFLEEGKAKMEKLSDELVKNMEQVQDRAEDLRNDVLHRRVRPSQAQVDALKKDFAKREQELRTFETHIKTVAASWKSTWEMELNRVVAEQGFLRQQEALLHDHKLDVQATREVVNIIDACVAAFAKQASPKRPAFIHTSPTNSLKTRDALLTEVRAKQPDHESRIDAIARAEAVRQKELEARIGEFEKELGDFVTEGKLKKTGGADEVERMRAARDELVRKAAFTKQAAVDTSEKEFQKEEEHVEAIRETPENAENPRNEDDDEGSASNAPSAEAAVTEETLVIEESLEDAPGAFPTEEASATAALSSAKESIEVPGPLNRTITEDGAGDVFMTPSTELTPAISADATSHPSISNVNEVEGHEAQNGMTDVEGTQSITEIENSVEKSVEEEGMEIPTVQVEQGQEDDDDEELR